MLQLRESQCGPGRWTRRGGCADPISWRGARPASAVASGSALRSPGCRAAVTTDAGGGPTRARLREVAELAGVHPSTASRVLSGSRAVRPDIAAAVQRAAEKLNYRVNPIGRALRGERTGTVGMVVPDIVNPF